MAWFDTGRSETVQYQFTLTARHAGGFGYPNPPPVCGSPQGQSQQLNEHPGSTKAELQEAWTTSRGEDVNDRRLPLEDDKIWDAMTLSRPAIRFGSLQPDVTYWFANMRLERKDVDDSVQPPQTLAHRDELRVLPPFQQDGILFHLCNGRPGLTENFRDGNTLRSIQNVVDSINNRLDSGFSATAIDSGHPYYNPNAPAGFLQGRVASDENFTSPLTLKGQVRADGIIPWAGMGDPTQSLPNSGTLTVKFTKYLRGKVEGLVFIRDLSPPDTRTTRVQVRREQTVYDTQTTDNWRYYRTVHLKAGAYEVVRIDENNNLGIPQSVQIVNREVGRVHLRARVYGKVTRGIISNATGAGHQTDGPGGRELISQPTGLYAIGQCLPGNYHVYADAEGFTLKWTEDITVGLTQLG